MSFPEAFIRQITDLLDYEAGDFLKALKEPAPISIRINPQKIKISEELIDSTDFGDDVPWSSYGKYLTTRPAFTFDPLLHAGCYYVQEASSMFVEQAINRSVELMDNDSAPIKMLDLCAAPGGKSTLSASVLPKGSLLVANELIRTRANILAENIIKWGAPNIIVTQSDSSSFSGLTDFFDIILTDMPCSGEGMFRKDANAINEWSEDAVRPCAVRQKDIIKKCWPALKPGGFLIYSTCTYNTTENEENINWICNSLGADAVKIQLQENWGISGAKGKFSSLPVYRFFPHKVKGEGFFLALLQKRYEEGSNSDKERSGKYKDKHKKSIQLQSISDNIRNLIIDSDSFDFSFDRLGRIRAFPKGHLGGLEKLKETLRIVHAGIVIGEIKGKVLLPDVSLALSTSLNITQVQTIDLNLDQAISYLRCEAFAMPESCVLGWILMLFKGKPIGWMKNIGSRANNSWPNEWRIRS